MSSLFSYRALLLPPLSGLSGMEDCWCIIVLALGGAGVGVASLLVCYFLARPGSDGAGIDVIGV